MHMLLLSRYALQRHRIHQHRDRILFRIHVQHAVQVSAHAGSQLRICTHADAAADVDVAVDADDDTVPPLKSSRVVPNVLSID